MKNIFKRHGFPCKANESSRILLHLCVQINSLNNDNYIVNQGSMVCKPNLTSKHLLIQVWNVTLSRTLVNAVS